LVEVEISGGLFYQLLPTIRDTNSCTGDWKQELQFLGYRNRFLPSVSAPFETNLQRGLWSHTLAKVATLPDVLYYALRSKPGLVPSGDNNNDDDDDDDDGGGDTKKRKRDANA
jgi:hypothetical protein